MHQANVASCMLVTQQRKKTYAAWNSFLSLTRISIHTLHELTHVSQRERNQAEQSSQWVPGRKLFEALTFDTFLKDRTSYIPGHPYTHFSSWNWSGTPDPSVFPSQSARTTGRYHLTINNIVIVRLCSLRGRPSMLASLYHTQELTERSDRH